MTKKCIWILFLCFLAGPDLAADRESLKSLSQAHGEEYCRLRDQIVCEGPIALPLLDQILHNDSEPWNLRFVSGVCSERIRHKDEVFTFENANWNEILHADSHWPVTAAGYQKEIVPIYHDWLLKHGLWYSYLERSSERTGQMSTGLERTLDSFILEHATGIHRWFAAKISESYAVEYLEGRNPFCGNEVGRLRRFVLDGTLPSGAFVFLDRASDERKTSAGTLFDYLPFVNDKDYLIRLSGRCKNLESQYHFIQRRIEALEAESQSVSQTNEIAELGSEARHSQSEGFSPVVPETASELNPISAPDVSPRTIPTEKKTPEKPFRSRWFAVFFLPLVAVFLFLRGKFRRNRASKGTAP